MTHDSTPAPLDRDHARPEGTSDADVEAAGTMSEALEYVHRVRGHLYSAHQLLGRADLLFGEAADQLDAAGHTDLARTVRDEVVGRNIIGGRWTFQLVEEFDDGYYDTVVGAERRVRDEVTGGRRHLHEAKMKQERRTEGHPDHTATPTDGE